MVDIDQAALAVKDLLQAFGVSPDESDHLHETPERSAKAWGEILAGYREDPADHLSKTFTAPRDPGLVIVAGVRLQSMCAHHLLPFSGIATVAYRPSPGQRVSHGCVRRECFVVGRVACEDQQIKIRDPSAQIVEHGVQPGARRDAA